MGNLWLVMDRETWGISGTSNHQSVWILFNHTLDQMRCVWSSMEDHFEKKNNNLYSILTSTTQPIVISRFYLKKHV
jgi:hypothetical protein